MPVPAEIQDALGELVGAAREGLLALSVGLGLRVVHELMECEVDEVVGPKGNNGANEIRRRRFGANEGLGVQFATDGASQGRSGAVCTLNSRAIAGGRGAAASGPRPRRPTSCPSGLR
jgi:hypothetical protein